MNPCPCGYAGQKQVTCQCSHEQIKRYLAKLSGPLLDRIDMHIDVPRVPAELLDNQKSHDDASCVVLKELICLARETQYKRQGKCNAHLSVNELKQLANIEKEAEQLLIQTINKFNLSARVYHRVIKLARTIADLEQQEKIMLLHISEALQYRALDRLKARFM
jgi:magnesium chelatase family protein